VCAHALDELNGRPLRTRLSDRALIALAAVSLVGAVAIGVLGVLTVSPSIAVFVAAGAFIVVAYNLELFGGRFHSDTWFALAWGAFPALTSYWANALTLRLPGVGVMVGCFALSLAQRRLSTPARELRRRTIHLSGTQTLADGREIELDTERLAAPLESALRTLTVAIVLIAAALVWTRL
jgi:ABC-type branched-subunit amino acid transport system permease subunit